MGENVVHAATESNRLSMQQDRYPIAGKSFRGRLRPQRLHLNILTVQGTANLKRAPTSLAAKSAHCIAARLMNRANIKPVHGDRGYILRDLSSTGSAGGEPCVPSFSAWRSSASQRQHLRQISK